MNKQSKFQKKPALLLVFLIGMTIHGNALAADIPTPGKKCIKAGQSVVVGMKKFTCVKTGKKLTWSKGVVLSATTSAPVSKGNASETQTVMIAPVAPKLPEKWPLSSAAKSVEDILMIADSSERRRVDLNSISDVAIDLRVGPTTSRNNAEAYISSLRTASKYWKNDFNPSTPVVVAMAEVQDFDFMNNLWPQFGLNGGGFDNSRESWSRLGAECNQGSAIYENAPFFWGCLPSNPKLDQIGLRKFSAHEYTHIAEYAIARQANSARFYALPNLFSEGSADFFGVTYASTPSLIVDDWKNYRTTGYISSEARSVLKSADAARMYQLITDSMNGGFMVPSHWYFTGAYATARLVAAEGHEGFVRYLSESARTRDAIASFKTVYGITFEEFARVISPELVDFAKLINR